MNPPTVKEQFPSRILYSSPPAASSLREWVEKIEAENRAANEEFYSRGYDP